MSVAFWSATVKAGSPVEVQPPEGFVLNLQQAALTGSKSGAAVLTVKTESIEGDELDTVIGTLRNITKDQISLNLVFGYDVPSIFSLSGDSNGTVHLSGYYQPGPDGDEEEGEDGDSFDSEDDEEEDSDEEEDNMPTADMLRALTQKAIPALQNSSSNKKQLVEVPADSESDEESSEDEGDDEEDDAFVQKMISAHVQKKGAAPVKGAKGQSWEMDSSDPSGSEGDDSDDGSDNSDEEESEEEEAPPAKSHKGSNGQQSNKPQQSTTKPNNHQQKQQQGQSQQKSNPNTPSKQSNGGGKPQNNNNKPQQKQGGGGGGNFKQQQQHAGDKRKH